MMRVVLDANVLAPGFLGGTSVSARLIALWRRGGYDLIVSEHLLQELTRAYTDAYFRTRIDPDQAARALRLLRRQAILTELTVEVTGVATQPKDDLVLATGLSGGAAYLATRDKQLLKLYRYQELAIVHPGDLLDLLEQPPDDESCG